MSGARTAASTSSTAPTATHLGPIVSSGQLATSIDIHTGLSERQSRGAFLFLPAGRGPFISIPGAACAHSWHPCPTDPTRAWSFSPSRIGLPLTEEKKLSRPTVIRRRRLQQTGSTWGARWDAWRSRRRSSAARPVDSLRVYRLAPLHTLSLARPVSRALEGGVLIHRGAGCSKGLGGRHFAASMSSNGRRLWTSRRRPACPRRRSPTRSAPA